MYWKVDNDLKGELINAKSMESNDNSMSLYSTYNNVTRKNNKVMLGAS